MNLPIATPCSASEDDAERPSPLLLLADDDERSGSPASIRRAFTKSADVLTPFALLSPPPRPPRPSSAAVAATLAGIGADR